MLWKGVRVQQAYGYCFYPFGFELLAELLEFSVFEGYQDLAIGRHPLVHFEAQAALD